MPTQTGGVWNDLSHELNSASNPAYISGFYVEYSEYGGQTETVGNTQTASFLGAVKVQYVSEDGSLLTLDDNSYNPKILEKEGSEAYTSSALSITGWTLKETPANANGSFNDDLQVVTYVYSANPYTVQFNGNTGTGSMANQAFTYDVEQALTTNTFTKTGYTFVSWNTSINGSGDSYTDGQAVSNLVSEADGTITLYAQWNVNAGPELLSTGVSGSHAEIAFIGMGSLIVAVGLIIRKKEEDETNA